MSLLYKFIGFFLSLLFHMFSFLFHHFLFSCIPLRTTTKITLLPLSWQRDLALSYTCPPNPPLNLIDPFQLKDEVEGRRSPEANSFRLHLKCWLYNYSCALNRCSRYVLSHISGNPRRVRRIVKMFTIMIS